MHTLQNLKIIAHHTQDFVCVPEGEYTHLMLFDGEADINKTETDIVQLLL